MAGGLQEITKNIKDLEPDSPDSASKTYIKKVEKEKKQYKT